MKIQEPPEAEKLRADVRVPVGSLWFDGHFPGQPLLPGVAQMDMVFRVIRQARPLSVRVAQIRRVRFKQMILPGDRLTVEAEANAGREGLYAFRILKKDQLICQGVMAVTETGDEA